MGSQEKASEKRWDFRGTEGTKDLDKSRVEGVLRRRDEVRQNSIYRDLKLNCLNELKVIEWRLVSNSWKKNMFG